jgi:aryl-alcohol dehydrogenase-like predicted oxidoreductase
MTRRDETEGASTVRYIQFGNTGMRVSKICFGSWAFGGEWGEQDLTANKAAVRKALDMGINFFDTAQGYGFGAAEQFLNQALQPEIRTKRQELVLSTKGGLRQAGDRLVRDSSRAWLREGLESSLRALGTDYIDLYLIHWPDPTLPMADVVATLDEFVREGKVRFVGGSNFSLRQIQAFEDIRHLDGLQPPYHLFRREIEADILPYCQQHHIGVQVYGPLAHGLLTGRFTSGTTFPSDDWRGKSDIFKGETFKRNLSVVEQLKQLAQQRQCSLPQLAVAWVLANPGVDAAIVGALNPTEIADTGAGADIQLTQDEMNAITRAMRDAVSVGGPSPEGTFTTAEAEPHVSPAHTSSESSAAPI